MKDIEQQLQQLFTDWSGEEVANFAALPGSGSYRRYFRISGQRQSAIGVFNEDLKENEAFLSFTHHFLSEKLPVPEVFRVGEDGKTYLLQDLGDTTLFGHLTSLRKADRFPVEMVPVYKHALECLPGFQIDAAEGLDYSKCYPRAAFDRQSMKWDLNYFKYYFLKLAKIPFDEQGLEDDFNRLTEFLLKAEARFFLYRDFQSRNIMLVDGKPYFIDYQGGRKGPLQYDVASLLYDGKAAIPPETRDLLLNHYLDVLAGYLHFDRKKFLSLYNGFVLIRILQALGAYGFRGYYENKPHFLQSIPYALNNLQYILDNQLFPSQLPVLKKVIEDIIVHPSLRVMKLPESRLNVTIRSFSFKKGVPADDSGHGGGFVFDCRALPNPGRFPDFMKVSGLDQPVMDYLAREPAVDIFLNHVFAMVDQSVEEYIRRDFTSLMVQFGCTGGQHRSVYSAVRLAKHLQEKFSISINITHLEKDSWIK